MNPTIVKVQKIFSILKNLRNLNYFENLEHLENYKDLKNLEIPKNLKNLPRDLVYMVFLYSEVKDSKNPFFVTDGFSYVKEFSDRCIKELRIVDRSFFGSELLEWKGRFVKTMKMDNTSSFEVKIMQKYMPNLMHLIFQANPDTTKVDDYCYEFDNSRCSSVTQLTFQDFQPKNLTKIIASFPEATTLKITFNQCVNLYSESESIFLPESKINTLYVIWASRFNDESSMPLSPLIVVNQLIRTCVNQKVNCISKVVFSVDIDSTVPDHKIVLDNTYDERAEEISKLAIKNQFQLTVDYMEVRCKTTLLSDTIAQLLKKDFFDKFPFMKIGTPNQDPEIRLFGLDDSMIGDLL